MLNASRFGRVRLLQLFAPLCLALLCLQPAPAQEEAGTDLFYSANALYNRRLFPIAIKEFQNFLQAHPGHSKAEQARYGMALSFYQTGMYKEAEPLFAALAEKGAVGDKRQLTLLRGHCLIKLDKFDDARAAFLSVVNVPDAASHHASAMAGMSEAYFKERKWTDVVTWANRLAASKPPDAELRRALYQGAWARHQLQQFTNAIPLLEQLADLSKDAAPSPQTSYLLGECYRETGRLREAAAQYEQAAKGLDGVASAETYYRLGYVFYVQKKYEEAIGAFKNATEKDPKGKFGDTAQLYLGRSYLEFGRPDEARRALDKLVGTGSPAAAPATLWISRIYSRDKRHEDALKILTPAIKQFQNDPALPDLLYDYANAHIAAGRYAEAAQGLARILAVKDWPQRADVLRMSAVCLHRAKDYANSLKTADEFLATYPDDKLVSEVHFVRAENLYFLDRAEDARAAYQAYVASRPLDGNADAATLRMAQIAHKQGKWSDALETALPLAAKTLEDEVFSQLFFVLGDAAFRLEKWDDAAKHLDTFTRKFAGARRKKGEAEVAEPNLDTGFVELAVSHLNRGDAAAASLAFRAVLSQCPQSPHVPFVLSELGRMYYESKDFKNARTMLEKFLAGYDKAPQRARVEYYLGWISLADGNEGEAAQHFSVVAKSFPKDDLAPDAALQWGTALIGLGKHDEARDAFRTIEAAYPKHPKMDLVAFSHGVAYARASSWEKALPFFKRVVENFPKSEVADRAVYEWAWCEKGLGRKDDAVKRYEQLIAAFPESDLIPKARTELAELTFDAKQYEQVIAQLKKSLDEAKDKTVREQATYRLGTAHFNKGDYESAAKTFETFLAEFAASPLRPSVHFQAGESRMNLKENTAAREHFESAVKKGNEQIRELGLLRLGETQGLTRMWKESAATYARLLKEFPKSKWTKRARFGLGWALERQSLFEEAIAEYRQALALPGKDETGARAQFQVGECLFALKKYDAAIQELMRVEVNYRLKDWSAKALLEVARALEAKGDKDRATAQFREVIQRFPDHDVAAVAKERLDDLRRGP